MLRVIQWATGSVGRHAVAAVHEHPDLELVGALVYSDAKAGRDVGDICGIGPIGVTTTKDPDEIVALDADCVLYMPQGEMNPMGALDDICRLLASGKNVVSTAVTGLIYPRSLGDKVVDKLESACADGQSSFHATGIEPGWAAEVLPLTMSGLFQRIDSLLVQELMDYTTYDSADMLFDIMGFGKAPDEPVPMADAALAGVTFRAPLMLLADGLGATIDDFVYHREVAVAAEAFDIKAGRVEAGTSRRSASATPPSSTAVTHSPSSTSPGSATNKPRTGRRAAAGRSPSKVGRRWCSTRRSPRTARTKPIRAAWAPPCTPSTPSLRSARRRRESVRSLTFR